MGSTQSGSGEGEAPRNLESPLTTPSTPISGEDSQAWRHLIRTMEQDTGKTPRSIAVTSGDVPPNLGAAHRDELRRAIERSNRSIHSITVGEVSSEAARLLTEACQDTAHLNEMKFTGSRVDDALGKLLAALLRPVWMRDLGLRCLVLANQCRNLLTDIGAAAIAQSLEDNRCLRTLVLFGTLMGDGAAKAISAALEQNKTLQVLVFYGKGLSGKGISSLARYIKSGSCHLTELVVGGSEFGDDDGQALAHSVASAKEDDANFPLLRFGILNVSMGDQSVYALADLMICGLREVTIFAGKLSDEGVAIIARSAMGLPATASEDEALAPRHAVEPIQSFCLATSTAGNAGLTAFSGMWDGGNVLPVCELAFGAATPQTCEELMLKINSADYPTASNGTIKESSLRSAADSEQRTNSPGSCGWLWQGGTNNGTATSQSPVRRVCITSDLPKYLEEVLFKRLMFRISPASIWD